MRIIGENEGKKFCIVTDVVGKEELMVHLASKFQQKVSFIECKLDSHLHQILVDKKKLDVIYLAEYYQEFFTDDPAEAGNIQGISRSDIKQKLSEGFIVFVPTGLSNKLSIEIEPNYYVIIFSMTTLNLTLTQGNRI